MASQNEHMTAGMLSLIIQLQQVCGKGVIVNSSHHRGTAVHDNPVAIGGGGIPRLQGNRYVCNGQIQSQLVASDTCFCQC